MMSHPTDPRMADVAIKAQMAYNPDSTDVQKAQAEELAPYMVTYTGRRVWLRDPHVSDVNIEDIAHHLASENRYGGAAREPYSVAQHSVHVSHLVPKEYAFQALMHDAHEAYTKDMQSPTKRVVKDYREFERRHAACVRARYNLPMELHPCVKRADYIALRMERRDLIAESIYWPLVNAEELPQAMIIPVPWQVAKTIFLQRFFDLIKGYPQCNS